MTLRPLRCLLSAALLAATFAAQAGEALTLQLKWTHAFQFAGYYAADAKGYYRDAGIEVRIDEAAPETDVVGRVMSGEAQFGVGGSNLILERHAGKPVVALAAIFQHSPVAIIARRGSNLQSIHDLAGKRLMLEGQSDELAAYLKYEGLGPDKLHRLKHSFNVEDLIEGNTDAMSAYQTFEPFLLQQRNFPYLLLTPRSAGIDFYGDVLFTSERELREQPERARAFLQASLRGWQYAMAHPDEIIALIRERYPERLSREHLEFEAARTAPLVRADLVPVGYMNPGRWRHIADTYAGLGMLPADFPLTGFLPADESSDAWKRLLLPLIAALLAVAALSAIALNMRRLNRRLRQSQRQLAERSQELALQNRVLQQLNHGAPLGEVLDSLTREVETQRPGVLCSILLLDADGSHLRHGSAPSLPDFYNQAIDGVAIGDAVGSCGTAAWRDERVIVDDIERHPYWADYRPLAARAGLRACWSQPFHGRDGKVRGTFALYHRQPATPDQRDIALIEGYAQLAELAVERSRSDEALRLAESRYRLISENANDVIWLLELPSLRFSYISPSVHRLRGWSAEEIMAQPMSAALTPESAARVEQALRETMAAVAAGAPGPYARTMEVDQPHRDGSIVPTEVVTTVLLDDHGQPTRILGITRDISERRRNEAALARHQAELEQRVEERTVALSIAKEAAEAASRAKSTFLATMSHELRTPMNAILGMTDLALRRASDAKQKDQLGKVADAARHLLSVINDILDLSRIEADRLTLEHIPFQLNEIVAPVQRLLEHLAAEKGLYLVFEVPETLARTQVSGDPHRLKQVLLNLCINAIKFTDCGGVTVHLALSGEAPHFVLHCSVEDTGIGVTPEIQRRLFEPFVQADGSMTRRYGGSGLGLAICKRLVEMMDGRIGLDSQPGRGSRFWFEARLGGSDALLPLPRNSTLDAIAALERRFAGKRILLAEDEPVNREVFRELLGDAGLLVDTANNGEAAIAMAGSKDYALILMDIQMPGIDGVAASQAIRGQPGGSELPIIAMTANAFSEDRQRCLDAGMDDHISKPVDPERLFATLYRWLAIADERNGQAAGAL